MSVAMTWPKRESRATHNRFSCGGGTPGPLNRGFVVSGPTSHPRATMTALGAAAPKRRRGTAATRR